MRNWLIGLTLALVPATASAQDTKTYLVAEVIPSDTAAYVREFADKVPPLVEAAGGRYLVRAMSTEAVEGTGEGQSHDQGDAQEILEKHAGDGVGR